MNIRDEKLLYNNLGDNKMETWKPVVNFEKLYEVSNLGNVRHIGKSKPLSPVDNGNGYLTVTLYNNTHKKRCRVHVLVAEAFIGPKTQGMQINHIDHDKTNNALSNLEYVTASNNMKAAGIARRWDYRLTDEEVLEIRAIVTPGVSGPNSMKSLAKRFNTTARNITRIVNGTTRRNIV